MNGNSFSRLKGRALLEKLNQHIDRDRGVRQHAGDFEDLVFGPHRHGDEDDVELATLRLADHVLEGAIDRQPLLEAANGLFLAAVDEADMII